MAKQVECMHAYDVGPKRTRPPPLRRILIDFAQPLMSGRRDSNPIETVYDSFLQLILTEILYGTF